MHYRIKNQNGLMLDKKEHIVTIRDTLRNGKTSLMIDKKHVEITNTKSDDEVTTIFVYVDGL